MLHVIFHAKYVVILYKYSIFPLHVCCYPLFLPCKPICISRYFDWTVHDIMLSLHVTISLSHYHWSILHHSTYVIIKSIYLNINDPRATATATPPTAVNTSYKRKKTPIIGGFTAYFCMMDDGCLLLQVLQIGKAFGF